MTSIDSVAGRRRVARAAAGLVLFAALSWLVLGLRPAAAQLTRPGLPSGSGCDPTVSSCAPPVCTPLDEALGRCTGTGGGGGPVCKPSVGGNPTCSADPGPGSAGSAGGELQVGGGNPINLITGDKYQLETDLAPLPGVLGLELRRHYNSLSAHAGLIGSGWHMSYETVLYDQGSQLEIVQADGQRLVFQRGTGAQSAVCARGGGRHGVDGRPGRDTWLRRHADDGGGSEYRRHQEAGRLARLDHELVQQLVLTRQPLKFDHQAFRDRLLASLSERADALWDERLALIDRESAEGWAGCHAQPLWIRANVQPPFVNDAGRRYGIETMKMALSLGSSAENPYTGQGVVARYVSDFVLAFFEQPFPHRDYRNFAEAGPISADGFEGPPFDAAVADVVDALRAQGRVAALEIARDREAGWQAALKRGVHSPEPTMVEREPEHPLARYGLPQRVSEFSALRSPDWILALMQRLAPEFVHAEALSTKKGLLFLKPLDDQLAWAVAVDKAGQGGMFRFGPSPTLSLVWRKDATGRRPPVVLYRDVLANDNRLGATWPREIELQLTYHLQRFRRLMAFYQPFIDDALRTG